MWPHVRGCGLVDEIVALWERTKGRWLQHAEGKCKTTPTPVCSPCIVRWIMRWYDAQERVCASLKAAGVAVGFCRRVEAAQAAFRKGLAKATQVPLKG